MKWEDKAWGQVAHLFNEHGSVSLLRVEADRCCSIHSHDWRYNQFVTIDATIDVVLYSPLIIDEEPVGPIGAETITPPAKYEIGRWRLSPHTSFIVPAHVVHRFEVFKSGGVTEIYWTKSGYTPSLDDIKRHPHFLGGPVK